MQTIICNNCKKELPISEFKEKDRVQKQHRKYKTCCQECNRVMTIERQKKSYQKLKTKRLAYQKEYYEKNKESCNERNNKWKCENPDRFKEYYINRKAKLALINKESTKGTGVIVINSHKNKEESIVEISINLKSMPKNHTSTVTFSFEY